jgi:hypothetical protein
MGLKKSHKSRKNKTEKTKTFSAHFRKFLKISNISGRKNKQQAVGKVRTKCQQNVGISWLKCGAKLLGFSWEIVRKSAGN